MSKVSEAIGIFLKSLRTETVNGKKVNVCHLEGNAIFYDAAPDMAALLLRCKPWIQDRLTYLQDKLIFMREANSSIIDQEIIADWIAELSSILAEMNGEEEKDE